MRPIPERRGGTLFFWKEPLIGKTHNENGENFIRYGKLYISDGMTGTSDKIKKMLKKSQKNVDYAEGEDYNLPVFERGTNRNKCPYERNIKKTML